MTILGREDIVALPALIEFISTGQFVLMGHKVFIVRLDQKTFDFAHLKGHVVKIDGQQYRVIGVECFMHAAPWWPGEPIGLMVECRTG